jgi:hypothetical protein
MDVHVGSRFDRKRTEVPLTTPSTHCDEYAVPPHSESRFEMRIDLQVQDREGRTSSFSRTVTVFANGRCGFQR